VEGAPSTHKKSIKIFLKMEQKLKDVFFASIFNLAT
jgi:hypothetical protein